MLDNTTKQQLEQMLKDYTLATSAKDYDKILAMLNEATMLEYVAVIKDFAKKMDVFGETEDFLKRLEIKDLPTLLAMNTYEVVVAMFQLAASPFNEKGLKQMMKGIKITDFEEADERVKMHYEFPIKIYDGVEIIKTSIDFGFENGAWKILFRTGLMNALSRVQREIDEFHARKAKDDLSKLDNVHDLETYTLMGYKNFEGDVVFEARFKEAHEFSEELARVKVTKKYGYLNAKGNFAIKPQFIDAKDFSEKLAAVQIKTEDDQKRWGFINKKGVFVIAAEYDDVHSFSEKLAAVMKNEKWGYINAKNEVVLDFQYDSAEPFYYGKAYVSLENEEGYLESVRINKKGKVKW